MRLIQWEMADAGAHFCWCLSLRGSNPDLNGTRVKQPVRRGKFNLRFWSTGMCAVVIGDGAYAPWVHARRGAVVILGIVLVSVG